MNIKPIWVKSTAWARRLWDAFRARVTRERALRLGWYGALIALLVVLGTASHAYRNRIEASREAMETAPRAAMAQSTPEPSATPAPMPQSPAYVWPVEGEIIGAYAPQAMAWSQTLGQWQTHDGIDIAASAGEAVVACADGTVADAWRDSLWGNVIEIAHPDGRRSVYAGVSTLQLVNPGDSVKAGEVISAIGNTASCEADLPWHLHFQLLEGDGSVDFEKMMANGGF